MEQLWKAFHNRSIATQTPTMKENEQFPFIWPGSAALIAPDSALVGFRPMLEATMT
jgi:hypothetical protein